MKIDGKSITDLVQIPVSKLQSFFSELNLSSYEINLSSRILKEINNRLKFINKVGLGYLTLNRRSSTLSW